MASCSFSHSFLFALTFSHAYASSQDEIEDEDEDEDVAEDLVQVPGVQQFVVVRCPAVAFGMCMCVGVRFKCACMRGSCLQCFYIECWLYKTTEQEKLIIQKRHRQTATETVDPLVLAGAFWGGGIAQRKMGPSFIYAFYLDEYFKVSKGRWYNGNGSDIYKLISFN